MKKILVAHPFKQHSFNVASALNKEGYLAAYCTTVYDKERSLMQLVKRISKGDLLKKAGGRKCPDLEDRQVLLFCELRGYIALAINRYCKSQTLGTMYMRYVADAFGKKVARYVQEHEIDAVIMFDTTASECFKRIKKAKPDVKLILDMSAAALPYCKHIYEEEEKQTGIVSFRETQKYLWNKRILSHLCDEFNYTDRFIVASDFTRRSMLFCGINEKKVKIVPYGIDSYTFDVTDTKHNLDSRLNIVYVGHVDYRKGLHHLLNALYQISDDLYELDLYGVYHENSSLYRGATQHHNIKFHGFVTPDRLKKIYNSADVFIFPSTNDGYGFVVLEALACGTPVICSNNVGACDLIENGLNGFVFESGNELELKKYILWCIDNRVELLKMRPKARESVLTRTGEQYNKQLLDVLTGSNII